MVDDLLATRRPAQPSEHILPDDGAQAILKFTRRRQMKHRVCLFGFLAEPIQLDSRKCEL